MAKKLPESPLLNRDGTSQEARFLAALDPASAPVDERSVEDLLAFARAYGKELRFFDEEDREAGDWSGLIDPRLDLGEIAAFMREPERFTPAKSPLLFRPHFILFLSYLKLLQHVRGELNGITRRHLDFYYRDVLGMRRKPATADCVNLLVDLAAGTGEARLPAGSTFSAGPDSLGIDRLYATDRTVVINRAQVARLSSVHVERRITGLREARVRHRNDRQQACMSMFEIALGEPLPGDPLPPYPDGRVVDFDLLNDLHALVRFAATALHLEFFELHDMMDLKRQRDAAGDEWVRINRLLEKAGRKRDASFRLRPTSSRAFDANLRAAMGGEPDFRGLPEVESIYDLYDQRIRQDVQEFVREKLFFTRVDDFVRMMQIKVRIDNEWREINRIIEQAGRRRDPAYRMIRDAPGFDPTAFDANLAAALGPIDYSAIDGVGDIEQYDEAVLTLQAYYFLSADEFKYVMDAVDTGASADWGKVDQVLTGAYRGKTYAARRRRLRQVRESAGPELGFGAMIRYALGETSVGGDDEADLERLRSSLGAPSDFAYLQQAAATPDAVDWERVYGIVEIAQRNREGRPEPVPVREEWLNLHAAPDATSAVVSMGIEGEVARWRTFGLPQAQGSRESPPPPSLGWALDSPLLAMAEGTREIVLTLGFEPEEFAGDELAALLGGDLLGAGSPLVFEVSTSKGWIVPRAAAVDLGGYRALSATQEPGAAELRAIRFRLTFGEDADPIEALAAEEGSIDTTSPVLRLMLRQIWNSKSKGFVMLYPAFRRLRLAAAHVAVSVRGLRTLRLQNDETTLDAAKPFEPFGSAPAVGSRLLVGHPELYAKRLDSLRFGVEWMGVPAAGHYANYPIGGNPSFTARVSLVDQRTELPLAARAPLFSGRTEQSIEVADVPAALPARRRYERIGAAAGDGDLDTWKRYLCWELNAPDFQHSAYPAVAAQKAVAMAAAIANRQAGGTITASAYQVNPPYTPKIKRLVVDYSSTTELRLDRPAAGAPEDRILHLHPFGFSAAEAERTADGLPFLPAYDNEGELYIGLRDLRPSQTVSLLLQMAEGSADPDLEPEPVRWSYLSGDRWIDLEDGGVLLDTTRGLINTGIIELAPGPAQSNTRLEHDLFWLRATAQRNSHSVCDTVAIHTQAVAAAFVDHDNAPDHFREPLPAESISRVTAAMPEIAGVRQPYTSHGGRGAEEDKAVATRVSERLRHKARALSMWDYERLVLEEFPEIYKAKCIPADLGRDAREPGRVEVVVIPDIRKKLPFNPFEPKAPSNLLADIEQYLSARAPASAALEVRNAHYIAVKARFAVRFQKVGNEGYYKQLLNDELNQFLSPWAYEEGADIVLGGKIYANSIVNFLDRRSYVDYITDIRLFSSEDGENFIPAPAGDAEGHAVTTGRPDGVLVAAREHEIDLIGTAEYEQEVRTGINYMRLELDLEVA